MTNKSLLEVFFNVILQGLQLLVGHAIERDERWFHTWFKWDLVIVGPVRGQFPCLFILEQVKESMMVFRNQLADINRLTLLTLSFDSLVQLF